MKTPLASRIGKDEQFSNVNSVSWFVCTCVVNTCTTVKACLIHVIVLVVPPEYKEHCKTAMSPFY